MILTKPAILAIKGSTSCRERLMRELSVSRTTVYVWIKENAPDGDLTKARALQIISEETGLASDQLLEHEQLTAQN